MLKRWQKILFQNHNKYSVGLILLGSLSWILTMFKSGLRYSYGMGFWGPNGHDGVWHIALSESLSRGTWNIPIFAGEVIKNYHVGFDLVLVILHKMTRIPILNLYFQVIPVVLSLGIGLSCYKLVYNWTKSSRSAFWSTFFVYFGGGFGWVVELFRSGRIGGESMFWSQQSISTLINPPFALSLLIIFIALNFLEKGLRQDKKYLGVATILFGILVQIKVYAGLLVMGGLLIAAIYRIFKKRSVELVKVFSGVLILSLLLLLPVLSGSSSVEFKPFWFLETMMSFSDRLDWQRFASAMVNYRLAGNWFKAIAAYGLAFVIFWYGNAGMRLIQEFAVIKWMKKPKSIKYWEVFIATIILAGAVTPMFFVQKGTAWNTIQFLYYSLIFSGILAGIVLGEYLDKQIPSNKKMYDIMIYHTTPYLILMSVVVLTIPTTIGTLWFNYLPSRPPAKLSHAEIEALEFLSNQPDGVVLTYPYDAEKAKEAESKPPRPLYLYESTAYVSAFSGKSVYMEDEVNLEITGYDWRSRRANVEAFLTTQDQESARKFLKENNIEFVYWIKPQRAILGEEQLELEKIFENEEVVIFNY